MIVVAIIGLLSALAIPSFQKARLRSRVTRVANDLRIFSEAFQMYAMDTGLYAQDTHNTLPPGMEDYIDPDDWAADALGGQYNWEGPSWGEGGGYSYAGIALFGTTAANDTLVELDELMDDGDLNTGMFRETANGRYTYIIEEQ